MEVNSRASTEVILKSKRWQERETSPERTKIWIEPKLNKTDNKLVQVVYYLSRNGQLDHPHFIEVSLSSSQGLYLRDVLNRLNFLRGKGMASMYSWSSKRNGFVWHDLSENDLITPTHGREYILKGSELLQTSQSFRYYESPENLPETKSSVDDCNFPATDRRRNQSWSSLDSHRYRVYKAESSSELAGESADAATQTDDDRRRRRSLERENVERGEREECECGEKITELGRDDVSPPLSSSSSKGVSGSGDVDSSADIRDQTADNERPSGRLKASQVLMQLISCGSVSVNNCHSVKRK